MSIKISEREKQALLALACVSQAGWCLSFKGIADRSSLEPHQVRRTVRALARKGLAEFHRGLFDDEGSVAGSGYCCTDQGQALAAEIGGEA
jgi:DNA-binding MarR family transcriptional regulator